MIEALWNKKVHRSAELQVDFADKYKNPSHSQHLQFKEASWISIRKWWSIPDWRRTKTIWNQTNQERTKTRKEKPDALERTHEIHMETEEKPYQCRTCSQDMKRKAKLLNYWQEWSDSLNEILKISWHKQIFIILRRKWSTSDTT